MPSATHPALDKDFFKNKKIKNFAESHPSGARQRNLKKIKNFAECHPELRSAKNFKKNKNKKLCRVPARAALGKEFKKK